MPQHHHSPHKSHQRCESKQVVTNKQQQHISLMSAILCCLACESLALVHPTLLVSQLAVLPSLVSSRMFSK